MDDEPLVLEGLANLLHKQRSKWHMVFALGGPAALAELAKGPFDVVVSDMRMPGMDGSVLLQRVKESYPSVARLILSGHAEREMVVDTLPVSHQYLNKPCDAETLRQVIERACELRMLLADPTMRNLVGQLDRLPSVPATYWELTRAFSDPDVATASIAKIVQQDPAMCVKILQLVNSAYFGLAQRMTSITQAVNYLGLELLKGLVLTSQIFSAMERSSPVPDFSIQRLQSYAIIVARLAKQVVRDPKRSDEAFTAGLVHDVGKIIMALGMPEPFSETIQVALESRRPAHVVEKELLGFTHADVGAYLLGTWGLPLPIVEAVAYHHSPALAATGAGDVLIAVHVADALADEAAVPDGAALADGRIDIAALDALGLAGELGRWRSMAREATRSVR